MSYLLFFCTSALHTAINHIKHSNNSFHTTIRANQPQQPQSQSRPDQPDRWLSITEPGCLCLFGVSGLYGLSVLFGVSVVSVLSVYNTDLWQFPMYKHTLVSTSTFSSFRDLFHLFPNIDQTMSILPKASNCKGLKLCSLCEEGDTFDVGRGHDIDVGTLQLL